MRVGQGIEGAITAPGCAVAHSVTGVGKGGDIDHLVATPGKLWVIETKVSRIKSKKRFSRALEQTARNTRARDAGPGRGTNVQGCLVLAFGHVGRKWYDVGAERLAVVHASRRSIRNTAVGRCGAGPTGRQVGEARVARREGQTMKRSAHEIYAKVIVATLAGGCWPRRGFRKQTLFWAASPAIGHHVAQRRNVLGSASTPPPALHVCGKGLKTAAAGRTRNSMNGTSPSWGCSADARDRQSQELWFRSANSAKIAVPRLEGRPIAALPPVLIDLR